MSILRILFHDIKITTKNKDEDTEDYIRQKISEGYTQGELLVRKITRRGEYKEEAGWWKILFS